MRKIASSPLRILAIKTAEITRPIRAARVSIPPPAPSNPGSDHEEDRDEEEEPDVDDSEILADLPDDTDVCCSPSSLQQKRVIADPVLFMWFVGCLGDRPRTFTAEIHIRIGSTTIRAHLEAIMFTTEPHQDPRPRGHEGAREFNRVGYVR